MVIPFLGALFSCGLENFYSMQSINASKKYHPWKYLHLTAVVCIMQNTMVVVGRGCSGFNGRWGKKGRKWYKGK